MNEIDSVLKLWADSVGNDWKNQLMLAWSNGNYSKGRLSSNDNGQLQRIRNSKGPSWLDSYTPPV